MAKLIRLTNVIDEIPREHKQAFYDDFGQTVKSLLQVKDFNIFYQILSSFLEWAKDTDLQDLNFCVPQNDPTVVQLLQNFMSDGKISTTERPL